MCSLLAWLGFRIEPHWVSKDGRRFMCNAQRLTARGEAQARWRETRVIDNAQPGAGRREALPRGGRPRSGTCVSRSESPPRGREVFLLSGFDDTGAPALLALRLPEQEPRGDRCSQEHDLALTSRSGLRHLVEEAADRRTDLVDVEQERVVTVG